MPPIPFDEEDEDTTIEEQKEEVKYRGEGSKPADDFYEGYCRQMLLKFKIRYRVYQTAKDLLDETDQCIKVIKQLNKRIPGQRDNFLKTELAFILKESIGAICNWVDEREHDEDWVNEFTCDSQRIQNTYRELIEYMDDASFPLEAMTLEQSRLKQTLNHGSLVQKDFN